VAVVGKSAAANSLSSVGTHSVTLQSLEGQLKVSRVPHSKFKHYLSK